MVGTKIKHSELRQAVKDLQNRGLLHSARWAAEQLSTAHWYDISAAKRDLGYRPRVSIEEGLQRLSRHLAGHP